MPTTTHDEIIERLQAAPEGSRELDADINLALATDPTKPHTGPGYYYDDAAQPGTGHRMQPYTTSLDAALTLVPEGWEFYVDSGTHNPSAGCHACVYNPKEIMHGGAVDLATPALAICIAALTARNKGSAS